MRKIAIAAGVGLLVVSQGCTLTIPAGVLNGLKGLNQPVGVTGATPGPVGTTSPGKPPVQPRPPIGTLAPFSPPPVNAGCSQLAMDTMKRYDQDGDGSWSYSEFVSWYAAQLATSNGCPVTSDQEELGLISNNAGAVSANAAVVSNAGTLVANHGGGLVSDHGPVISNNGGALIDANGAAILLPPRQNCFPDPKSAFLKTDLNGDGKVSIDELCGNPFFPPFQTVVQTSPVPTPYFPSPTPGGDCHADFKQADTNGDGFVDFQEFQFSRFRQLLPIPAGAPIRDASGATVGTTNAIAVDGNLPMLIMIKQQFSQLDANGDGRLDGDEWCGTVSSATPTPMPFPTATPVPGNCDLLKADLDGDAAVTWGEYYSYLLQSSNAAPNKDIAYTMFTKLDRNGDGQLYGDELCNNLPPVAPPVTVGSNCGQVFDKYDTNHDGYLSYDEYAEGRWSQIAFIKAPGAAAEASMKASFRTEAGKYDADGDGQLSLAEFIVACPTGSVVPNNGGG